MGNSTIQLAEVHTTATRYTSLADRDVAVTAMCDWINGKSHKSRSPLPGMLVEAFRLSKAVFARSRLSKNKRAEKIFRALSGSCLKMQGRASLTEYMLGRVWALTWLPLENKITALRRREDLCLVHSNDLRISLPAVYDARYKGKKALLLLYNDARFPLRRKGELTDTAQTIWSAFAFAADGRYFRRDLEKPEKFVSDAEYLLVVDITRVGRDMRATILVWPLTADLSLAAHKLDFSTKLEFLSGLYSDACQKLGLDDKSRYKEIPATVSDLISSEQEKRSSAG